MSKIGNRGRSGKGDLRVEFKVQMPKYWSTNQRAIIEMLANETGDQSAKRVMTTSPDSPGDTKATSSSPSDPTMTSKPDSHENEGFLKRVSIVDG